MKSEPLPQQSHNSNIEVSPERAGTVSGLPRRVGAWLLHELREALPPTIFFFLGFNLIVLTTNLLVSDYAAAVSNFMLATLGALVVGKAVMTANALPFLTLFDRAPLMLPILSLAKDAPITRPIECFGRIIAEPMVGGLHHRYARI